MKTRTRFIFYVMLCVRTLAFSQSNPWQKMAFPEQYDGTIFGLHETPNGTLYASTWMGGLVRSTDGGETWEQRFSSGGSTSVLASTSTGVMFYGAGDGGGLYRSTNGGQTWLQVGPHGIDESTRCIAVSSLDHIFMGNAWGETYRSTNDGASWTPMVNGLPATLTPSGIVTSHYGGNEFIFLAGQDYQTYVSTLYRSSDDGASWTPVASQSYIDRLFAHANGSLFFVGPSGVMRSTNNGDAWQVAWPYEFNTQQMISLPNGDIWSGNNNGPLLRSTDNGITWTEFPDLGSASIYALLRLHDGSVFMGTEGTGLFKTTDEGLTWTQKNTGFPGSCSHIGSISGIPGGVMVAGSANFGGFLSTNSGATWVRLNPGPNNAPSRVVVHPGGRIYASSSTSYNYGQYLMNSTDMGLHWQNATWFVQNTNNPIFSADAAIDDAGNLYSCGQGTGVIRSTDAGATWTWLPCPGQLFDRMHVSGSGMIIVQTPYETSYPYRRYFFTRISTDGGSTWNQSSPGSDQTRVYDYASTLNGYLFAGAATGVYRSTDFGGSWQITSLTLPDIKSFTVNSIDALFAGSSTHGVFRSTDDGVNWTPFSVGLPDSAIESLHCDADGFLYAGTATRGIFRTAEKTTGIGIDANSLPAEFALLQNYPNPFNPTTVISCQLPVASNVKLAVYDLLGREVAVLVDGRMEAGVHEVTFNASGLASGIYLCRLRAGSFMEARKLVLLR